ncbi:MAG: metallophosphatase domain-containing protein [Deltaproteobacteria bacterium]|nr:metallophosphatase domain-containing protein [Deltaproteobacteria bacterium]
MDLVLISDTHNSHAGLQVPPCDFLVHAGDFTRHGTLTEAEAFFAWFAQQPAKCKVLTAGNHDFIAERDRWTVRALARQSGVTYLVDEGCELLGLRLWASPYTPRHGEWAFQDDRGASLAARWAAIPEGLDVLVTHGPPHGVLDRTRLGLDVGCEALLDVVRARPPRVHVFGHVHEAHGEASLEGLRTVFVNASSFVSTSVRNPTTEAVRAHRLVRLG